MELGCDCLGEIAYLDAHLADDSGGVRTIANAICVHEEDAAYGLPHWTEADRSLEDADVVLWYTVGSPISCAPRTGRSCR